MSFEYADGRKFPLQPGDILLTPAGTEHRDIFCSRSNLKLQLIHFDLEKHEDFFPVVTPEKVCQIVGNTRVEIGGILANMRNDLSSADADMAVNECRLNTILQLIYREILSGSPLPLPLRNQERLGAEVRHYLETNFSHKLSLADVAKVFAISSYHLSHLFKEENGTSFIDFLTNLRMREAGRLLRDTHQSIAEIAYAVGYENSNYFTRLFQRHKGISPSSFRDAPFKGVERTDEQ